MIARRIEQLEAVDGLADVLQAGAAKVVPPDSPLKRFLNGPWLGHPLHPALTDLVIGSWTGAWLLEVVGGRENRRAADSLLEVGTLAALPTALSGVADWSDLQGGTRRVGAVHAVGNTAALLLQVCSLAARKKEHRSAGLALSTAASSALSGSWLARRPSVVRDGRRGRPNGLRGSSDRLDTPNRRREARRGRAGAALGPRDRCASRSPAREPSRAPRPLLTSRLFPQRRRS